MTLMILSNENEHERERELEVLFIEMHEPKRMYRDIYIDARLYQSLSNKTWVREKESELRSAFISERQKEKYEAIFVKVFATI